jgi:DNA-cytosine methyltransferase
MGWQPVFFSEIEPFPCAVLKAHYPNVPNLGDMSKITFDQTKGVITNGKRTIQFHGRLDLLAGGTPCQDFSVAGKRAGGAEGSGTRSSLMWQWLRLAAELRPRVIFWENVVGCLSTNNGRDFSQFVAAVGELGYCVAWRVLDCQYTRVDKWPMAIPQRRRRVWLVGCADAEPTDLAEILFEHRSLVGDTAPRRRTREEIARSAQGGNPLNARVVEGFFDNVRTGFPTTGDDVNHTVCTKNFYQGVVEGTIALDGDKLKPRTDQRKGGNGFGINEENVGYTLTVPDRHGVAYKTNPKGEEVAACLSADDITQSGQCYVNNSVIERTVPFVKTTHARSKDGEGERWEQSEVAGTRNVFDNGEMRSQEAVIYRIDPLSSNSMKSANPNSGIHKVAVAQTLDTTTPTPVKNQGGDVIVEGVDGYNKTTTGDVAPTISGAASDIHHTHGVIVSNSNGGDVMPTISANESKLGGDNQHIDGGGGYIVHEL